MKIKYQERDEKLITTCPNQPDEGVKVGSTLCTWCVYFRSIMDTYVNCGFPKEETQ